MADASNPPAVMGAQLGNNPPTALPAAEPAAPAPAPAPAPAAEPPPPPPAAEPPPPPPAAVTGGAESESDSESESDDDAPTQEGGAGLFGSTVTVDDSSFDTLISSAEGFNGKEEYAKAVENVRAIFASPDRYGVDAAIKAASALVTAGKALRAGGQVPASTPANPLPEPAAPPSSGGSHKSRHVTPKRRRSARQGLSKKKRHSRK